MNRRHTLKIGGAATPVRILKNRQNGERRKSDIRVTVRAAAQFYDGLILVILPL